MDTTSLIDRVDERLADLEAHIHQLDMIQQLLLRLMSIMHPLSNVLAQYGATSTQEQEIMQYLDQLAERVQSLERNRPSLEQFNTRIAEIMPDLKDDRDFARLIIDTLRVERAAYRDLYDYMIGQVGPSRPR
jgi:DNA repair ATPase RecN